MLVKDDFRINAELLNECERFIWEKLGIDLRLARKPMECEVDYEKEIAVDLSNVVVDNDPELSSLIQGARSGTSGRLAHLAFYLMKGKYICIRRKQWYKFGPHRWREISGCPSMDAMHIMIDPIGRWYDLYISELERISGETDDAGERQYLQNTIEKGQDDQDLEDLMDAYTSNVVFDEKPYLLCFENGVYDLLNDAIRPGLPEDYLSIGVPYALPGNTDPEIDGKLDTLLESIFPNVDLRDYVMKTMCTCLEGIVAILRNRLLRMMCE
ncbi:hypothetical protein DFS34DRAFT_644606 [Phlyctochytrium arcticum]|nr:hypothetical protein DFS34DRAFT_644606 [Phlyctochytrium arcticum]